LDSSFNARLGHLALAQQLNASAGCGLPQGVNEFSNKAMAPDDEGTPQIRACKVETGPVERTRLHSHDLGNFYETAPHIAATLERSASTTSDQTR
jgi:hypothetical protein